jgi:hypothetical protein
MSKEEKAHGKMRISSENGGMSRSARIIITLLVLAAILLTTGFFAARTDGGREFIEDWLGRKLDMKLTAGRTRIGWPYVLVIQDLVSEETSEADRPLLKAGQIKIGLGFKTRWRVDVHRCVLDLVVDKDGAWRPSVFSRLGNLPGEDLAEVSRATAGFRKRIALRISDSTVRWLDRRDEELASMKELSFSVTPAKVPGHEMYCYKMFIYDCSIPGVGPGRAYNVEREWLSSESRDFIALDGPEGSIADLSSKFFSPGVQDGPEEKRVRK